jgi:hypothetical protein
MVPDEKGRVLEGAVHAIERVILQTSPALQEKQFRIDTRKIIDVGGVHHEIDIFVTVEIANGYNATFIFECKNWATPVGKNEIIVFAEKINAAVAQHGYIVAPSFTKDAEAQAAKDPRIHLLVSTEHDPALARVPDDFHYTAPETVKLCITFLPPGGARTTMATVDIDTTVMLLSGTRMPVKLYLASWADDLYPRRLLSFWTAHLPAGIHPMQASEARSFSPGQCMINGKEIGTAELEATYGVRILRPPVFSDYEVATRGRVVRLAPATIRDDLTITTSFVTLQN